MGVFVNLSDRLFGELTPMRRVENNRHNQTMWECVCSCGDVCVVSAGHLISGHTLSCGCWMKKMTSAANRTHGMTNSLTYSSWLSMRRRCTEAGHIGYADYGGCGITVCDRWLNSFESFLEDMGVRPSKGHSLDRIDNNVGYCKENCRWATAIEQANNKSTNRKLTHDGETLSVREWSERFGIRPEIVHNRRWLGWSVEEALTTPVGQRRPSRKISPEPA